MTIVGLAALPTTPSLFADRPDADARRLRDAVDRVLARLPDLDAAVLLAAGDEALIHDAGSATVARPGQPDLQATVRHDEALLGALAARGQTPRFRDDTLTGALAALAVGIVTARPDVCFQPVTVPRTAAPEALEAVGAGLVGAARATGRRVLVVAAGDLGASGRPATPGWDHAAYEAVRDGDRAALAALGPDDAAAAGAAGWAPLVVMQAVAALPLADAGLGTSPTGSHLVGLATTDPGAADRRP